MLMSHVNVTCTMVYSLVMHSFGCSGDGFQWMHQVQQGSPHSDGNITIGCVE